MAVTSTEWYFLVDTAVYGGRYKVNKDDGTTVEGIKFFAQTEYGQEVQLTDDGDDSVYTNGQCSYTKDSDGNPVYHDFITYMNTFTSLNGFSSDTSSVYNVSFTIIDNNGTENTITKNLIDDFNNGVCDASTDDYNLTIDLVNKNVTFKPKTSGYKFKEITLPYSSLLVHILNNDINLDLPEQRKKDVIAKVDSETVTIKAVIGTNKDNIIKEIDNKSTNVINEIDSKYDSVITEIDNQATNITNNVNDNTNDLLSETTNSLSSKIDTQKNNIVTEVDNKAQEIEDKFDSIIVQLSSLSGSSGAKYDDGDIVTVKNYLGNWKVKASFLALNERGVLKIAYKLQKQDSTDTMIVFQELIDSLVQSASDSSDNNSSQ